MDARIDLTENRDFRSESVRHREFVISNGNRITSYIPRPLIPWRKKEYFMDSAYLKELVYTGDKREIKSKRMEKEYYTERVCECCSYKPLPWEDMYYGLCKQCDSQNGEVLEFSTSPFSNIINDIVTNRARNNDVEDLFNPVEVSIDDVEEMLRGVDPNDFF